MSNHTSQSPGFIMQAGVLNQPGDP